MNSREVSESVEDIIRQVRERGDEALLEYTARWDRAKLSSDTLRIPPEVLARPPEESDFVGAYRRACARIERFHVQVKPRTSIFEDEEGVWLGMRWTAVNAVGLYVPGGQASYPSTLAMTVIPARIAGVRRIVVVSPPGPDGEVSAEVLMAARVLGIDEVYRVGGAQAIAALAFGTETIPRVDKIFGPGNAFVAEAKQQLYGVVGIDMVAGPSEIVVYADDSCEPDWIAADLMAQAEHDVDTGITLLASSQAVLDAVRDSYSKQVAGEARRETIETALERGGRFEVVSSQAEAADRINEIAPEHLSLQVEDPWRMLGLVHNAGAIFLGKESPVAVGDYYAGPNHVLPTGSTARFASCLSVEDFMKRSNIASLSLDFISKHGEDVEILAAGERLPAHATSVRLRRTGRKQLRARPGLRSVTPYQLVEEDAEVKLNQNESPYDIPAEIKAEVAERLGRLPWNRYQQKLPGELCERIAEGAGVEPDQVIVGNGSNLLLQWIFEAYGGPGRSVLAPTPSFALYPLWAEVTESKFHTVRLGDNFAYDAMTVATEVRRLCPSLTVLCLPNNPTGSEMSAEGVALVLEAVEEIGGLLVIDEAYLEFSSQEGDRSSLLAGSESLVLLRTCSKAFSAAGVRLGYLLTSKSVAAELRKLVPPFHVSLFNAVLGIVLWEKKSHFDEKIVEIRAERERVAGALKESGLRVYPSEANFLLVEADGVPDAATIFDGLAQRRILVRRPGGDSRLESCLRVNVGTREENDRFLTALADILERS